MSWLACKAPYLHYTKSYEKTILAGISLALSANWARSRRRTLKANGAILGSWNHGTVVCFGRLRCLEPEIPSGWCCESNAGSFVSCGDIGLCRQSVLPIVVVNTGSSIAETLVDTVAQVYLQAAVSAVAIGIGRLSFSILRVWASIVRCRRCRRKRSQSHNQA
jgi:hypothetical protein